MSGIPPDIAGSSLQAGFQARDVGRVRDNERVGQAHSTDRTSKAIDEAGSTVETEDSDTAIFADAEGTGSKGRDFEEEPLQEEEEQKDGRDKRGESDDGQVHLDIQA
ncbi:MAG TPA: hypothetical protein VM243_07675 [Phycisphaerae bacterium]|nr:hypothetical protein [Phycisphaerae bacterium]